MPPGRTAINATHQRTSSSWTSASLGDTAERMPIHLVVMREGDSPPAVMFHFDMTSLPMDRAKSKYLKGAVHLAT